MQRSPEVVASIAGRVHRRQFLIGPEPVSVYGDWRTTRLQDGVFLSHCPTLPTAEARDADGAEWWLLGTAAQTDPTRADPLDEIARARTADVPLRVPAWAGRWLLIGDGRIIPDASGLLGCYVHAGGRAPWFSSSTALLAARTHAAPAARAARGLRHGTMNWWPPPATRYDAIAKLLPSQTIALSTGETCPRPWLPPRDPDAEYASLLDALRERLTHAMRRMAQGHETVWVPLSAGYDSRLVLSLAQHAGLPVKTYTWRKVNDWWNAGGSVPRTSYTSDSDMTLPPRIAAAAGVEHRWIDKGPFDPIALQTYDAHSDGNTLENDRTYYTHGQWSWCGPSDLILRGGVFEVGHRFYHEIFDRSAPAGSIPDAAELIEMFHLDEDSVHAAGVRGWVDAVRSQPGEPVDWRERLYVEQRVAGWLSALEQALDLVPGDRFYAVNASELFALLLSLPEGARERLAHHTDLIAHMTPELLEIPINPPEPILRRRTIRTLQRVASAIRKVRALGL